MTKTRNSRFSFSIVWVLLVAVPVLCQSPQSTPKQQAVRPINMLVLGDSIMWGQGLKPDHKPSYHVKFWLEKNYWPLPHSEHLSNVIPR